MPPVFEAQRRWAFANNDKPGKEGAAAKEFAEADPGGKLPARKASHAERRKSLYTHPRSKPHD
jgi:hypothetical protein